MCGSVSRRYGSNMPARLRQAYEAQAALETAQHRAYCHTSSQHGGDAAGAPPDLNLHRLAHGQCDLRKLQFKTGCWRFLGGHGTWGKRNAEEACCWVVVVAAQVGVVFHSAWAGALDASFQHADAARG